MSPSAGQGSPDRGKLAYELKSGYELTKMQFADPTKVRTPGAVYVVAADGILASLVTAGTDLKRIVDGYLVSEAEASAPKRLALGKTREEVERALGKPKTIVDLGNRTIYTYPDVKVTFTDGKVTDVQ